VIEKHRDDGESPKNISQYDNHLVNVTLFKINNDSHFFSDIGS
jgi:hypothetical protein